MLHPRPPDAQGAKLVAIKRRLTSGEIHTTRVRGLGMHLNHLGLTVRDQQRSLAFYEVYFQFDKATARTYPDGTVIVCNPDGFDLALHAGEIPAQSSFLHFGFALASPDDVHTLLARMSADGIQIVERDDEPDLVSFKCHDPDGWRIEVYWELARPG